MKICLKFIIIIAGLLFAANATAQETISDGRKVIKSLESEISQFLLLSDYELSIKSRQFQNDYKKITLPRLRHISKNIADNAIHWVDVANDQSPELIFWTEGLAGDVVGVREFLFVAMVEKSSKFNKKPKNQLLLIRQLNPEPSKDVKQYEYSRFWSYPNRSRGYNNFLSAVFSYATFGLNATNFVNYEIFWNRDHNKIDISEFYTSFPVAVEKSADSESWEKSPNNK
jgi:hypothetical protein